MEYYFPEDINISLLAEASTAIINNQTITNFPSYKKQLVQINQQTKDTPDYLFFTIRGSGTTATNPEGYLVFYGVKEWVDTVPSEIYDHAFETGMFEYDNGNMKMYNDIDMNNHRIKNIPPPTNPTDLPMKQSIEIYLISLHGMINQDKYFTTNNQKLFLFQISIEFIIIFGTNAHLSTQDKLTINYITLSGRRASYNYPFSFHSRSPNTRIGVYRVIKGKLESITTLKTFNVPFILYYAPVTIKTT